MLTASISSKKGKDTFSISLTEDFFSVIGNLFISGLTLILYYTYERIA